MTKSTGDRQMQVPTTALQAQNKRCDKTPDREASRKRAFGDSFVSDFHQLCIFQSCPFCIILFRCLAIFAGDRMANSLHTLYTTHTSVHNGVCAHVQRVNNIHLRCFIQDECCHEVKALSLKNNWKIWKASKNFPSGVLPT